MTDFTWVKDAARRKAVLKDYLELRELMESEIDNIQKFYGEEELRAIGRELGILNKDGVLVFRSETEMAVMTDYALFIGAPGGKGPVIDRWNAAAGKNEDESLRRFRDANARYRYTWLLPVASKAGFGVRCRDVLLGEEIFLVDRNMSSLPNFLKMGLMTMLIPCGDCWMTTGAGLPFAAAGVEKALEYVWGKAKLGDPRPRPLDRKEQSRFAAESVKLSVNLGLVNNVRYE